MAIQAPVLGQLFKTKAHSYILAADQARVPDRAGYGGPLSQPNPQYFIRYTEGIAAGIGIGTPTVNFNTVDAGLGSIPPVPGVGTGIGIIVDAAFFEKTAYSNIYAALQQQYGGRSVIEPYEALTASSYGVYLKAICRALSEAVAEHFATCWTLTSAHPIIYLGTGNIINGGFFGIEQDLVKKSIISQAPEFKGEFWPIMVDAIARAYKVTIETRSTGTVAIAGICVPSQSQVCAVPSAGAGTGIGA